MLFRSHGQDGNIPNLDWASIARGSPTIVLYMARKHAVTIVARFIEAGRNAAEPAAIISNASLPTQTTQVTTLAELGQLAAEADTPAIIVVGENVRLAAGLDWLGALTQGKTLDPDPLKRQTLRDAV